MEGFVKSLIKMKECVITVSYWMYCLLECVLTFKFQQHIAGAGYNFSFFLLIYQHDIMVPGYGFPFFFILNEVADYSKKKKMLILIF